MSIVTSVQGDVATGQRGEPVRRRPSPMATPGPLRPSTPCRCGPRCPGDRPPPEPVHPITVDDPRSARWRTPVGRGRLAVYRAVSVEVLARAAERFHVESAAPARFAGDVDARSQTERPPRAPRVDPESMVETPAQASVAPGRERPRRRTRDGPAPPGGASALEYGPLSGP